MPREAIITYDQVAAAAEALADEGVKTTVRAVRERLGSVGSMQTIARLLQAWRADKIRQRESGLGLPASVHQSILSFVDSQVVEARTLVAAQLAELQLEVEALAADNDQLIAENDIQAKALATLTSNQAKSEGRLGELSAELARLREALQVERQTTETVRIELAKTELRLEALPRLESELASWRQSFESERQARVVAEQSVAVLSARKAAPRRKSARS